MSKILRFIWQTIVGGVLFLAPLVLLLILIRTAVKLVATILGPIAKHLPFGDNLGLTASEIAAVLLLLLVGFGAGLVAQFGIAARLSRAIEQIVLRKMPGYTLFRSIAHSAAGKGEA
jgi:uncharacterized membrane protein